jgi:hypothetical protein
MFPTVRGQISVPPPFSDLAVCANRPSQLIEPVC